MFSKPKTSLHIFGYTHRILLKKLLGLPIILPEINYIQYDRNSKNVFAQFN